MHNRTATPTPMARLRALLESRSAVPAPGCHDPLGALLIAEAGFEAVSLSGYSVAASHGKPDIGLISGTQMAAHAGAIAEIVSLPVVADADTGYGGISNIAETVKAYERAGVAALHLEDQLNPKRCGAMASKSLVSDEEMSQRLRAAIAARGEMLIIGRTDALTIAGLPEAIRRCKSMADSGVDAVMVPSLSSLEDIERVVQASPVPVLHTVAETVRPLYTQSQLESTGLGMVLYSISLIQAIVHVQRAILSELKQRGSTASFVDAMLPLSQLSDFLGARRYAEFESQVLAKAG
ncbi:isocitrate lyase/PEP mutase family protein [Paralcaligenes sp. KSB-10]|uniref:isocitrate lyase/PEP mutase family protein n=1 Tax=Paralcaligenes sp. KSB-10 TaxID=2901142 RepID=UPI001E5E27DC|nr:isocitrate lyase/PEP mutase family protein [Paralcaligenes sp. KSB-10]UHL64049.1 isocitrate lyase/PEP mutase family protein [Paralcaligenes sp. KSB-10]